MSRKKNTIYDDVKKLNEITFKYDNNEIDSMSEKTLLEEVKHQFEYMQEGGTYFEIDREEDPEEYKRLQKELNQYKRFINKWSK